MTEARPGAVASASLWERDGEVATLGEAITALRADSATSGTVLVLTGEAGLGKTALLAEARRIAESNGCAVWSARGGETVTSVPFNVVRQLLQPALLSLLPEEAREYLGDWYDIAGPALGIAEPGDRQPDPQGVCDGLVAAVRRLAKREWPLVLLIDDAHWADQETLRWLASFAERLDDLSVLVVMARRPGGVGGESARLLDAVAAVARPVSTLTALTPAATEGLTRATLGEHADAPFCREVWAVTGGNPYETVELLAKVQDSDLEPVEGSAAELRDLNRSARGRGLVARLEGLGIDATRFAWAAAILGTGISLDLAAQLAGMPDDDASRCAELLGAARILTAVGSAGGRSGSEELEFVHPLIASAVYRSIPDALRTAMHGQAAWAVTESGRGAAAASRHLLEVHPDDDPELVEQMREAAREHLAVGAPDAARRCLERALKEPPLPEVHARVLYELGCATLLTAPATTIGHLRAALERPGLEETERVDAVFRLSQALLHNNQLDEAVRTVDAEVEQLEPGPARMRLQAVHYMWEGIHAGEERAGQSSGLAELVTTCTGRDNSERALLILRGFDAMPRGENAEVVVELCDRALVNGRLAPGLAWTDTEWGVELLLMLGSAYAYTDRLDRAESLFSEALHAYVKAGWSGGHLSLANAYLGLALRRRGRLADAEHYQRASLRLAERVGRGLPCTGRRPAGSSTPCWPAGTSGRRRRSPSATASHLRTPPRSSCPTPVRCAAGSCSPPAAPRRASTNWRRRRRPPPRAATTTRCSRPGPSTSRGHSPTRTRPAPPPSPRTPAARPSGSAPTRRSARPCGAPPPSRPVSARSGWRPRPSPIWKPRPASTNTRRPASSTASRPARCRN